MASRSQPCADVKNARTNAEPSAVLRVLSLFAGIGGFDLGLERAGGFRTVRFCERDAYCQAMLAKHWPGVPCSPDATTAEFQEGEADVIVGGFPCQDLSNAGAGAGLAGARSGLYRELVRAIRVVRPLYAIVENVAALLGRGLGTVLGDLAESGYDAAWDCLPASAVGAPHQRDRIWIVAHPRGKQHEGAGDAVWGQIAAGLPEALEWNASLSPWDDGETDAQCSDAHGLGPYRAAIDQQGSAELRHKQDGVAGPLGEVLADAICVRQPGPRKPLQPSNPAASGEGQASHAVHGRVRAQWATEPNVGRVAYGVPDRVDRLRALGNAVVPQIPELIGRAILAAEAERLAA